MADGLNDTRALRIAEVMNDFRNIQHSISQYQVGTTDKDYHEAGYRILRECHAEAQAVLAAHFDIGAPPVPSSPGEQTKKHLQRILLDASARRFRAQKIYLRAVAAIRWVNTRNSILQGQKQHAGHAAALQQADNNLRAELHTVTDEKIDYDLRTIDRETGNWLVEDPSLATLQSWIGSQHQI